MIHSLGQIHSVQTEEPTVTSIFQDLEFRRDLKADRGKSGAGNALTGMKLNDNAPPASDQQPMFLPIRPVLRALKTELRLVPRGSVWP